MKYSTLIWLNLQFVSIFKNFIGILLINIPPMYFPGVAFLKHAGLHWSSPFLCCIRSVTSSTFFSVWKHVGLWNGEVRNITYQSSSKTERNQKLFHPNGFNKTNKGVGEIIIKHNQCTQSRGLCWNTLQEVESVRLQRATMPNKTKPSVDEQRWGEGKDFTIKKMIFLLLLERVKSCHPKFCLEFF